MHLASLRYPVGMLGCVCLFACPSDPPHTPASDGANEASGKPETRAGEPFEEVLLPETAADASGPDGVEVEVAGVEISAEGAPEFGGEAGPPVDAAEPDAASAPEPSAESSAEGGAEAAPPEADSVEAVDLPGAEIEPPQEVPDLAGEIAEPLDVLEAGKDAAGTLDAPTAAEAEAGPDPEACVPACPEGTLCVQGICLAECGMGTAFETLLGAVGPGWSVTGSGCAGTAAAAFAPLDEASLLELRIEPDGTGSTVFHLVRAEVFEGAAGEDVATWVAAGTPAAGTLFPGHFLAVSPEATRVAFGYRGPFQGGATPGKVVVASLIELGAAPSLIDAPAVVAAEFAAEDALLINGLGAGGAASGQGLYLAYPGGAPPAAMVISQLGVVSGGVAVGAGLVLAGGDGDPWPCSGFPSGSLVVQAALVDVMGAASTAPLDACTATPIALGVDFSFLADGRLFYLDPATGLGSLADVGDNGLVDPTPLWAAPAFATARGVPGTDAIVLGYPGGYLRVAPE